MESFAGRIAVITGGGDGMGRELAVQLGRRFEPDTSLSGHYQSRVTRYEKLIHSLHGWSSAS